MKREEKSKREPKTDEKSNRKRTLYDTFCLRLYALTLAVWAVVMAVVTVVYTVDTAQTALDYAEESTMVSLGTMGDQSDQRAEELFHCANLQVQFSDSWTWKHQAWWECLFVPQRPGTITGAVQTNVYASDGSLLWDSEGGYALATQKGEDGSETCYRALLDTEAPGSPLLPFVNGIYGVWDGDLFRVKGYTYSFWDENQGEPLTGEMAQLKDCSLSASVTWWQNGVDDPDHFWSSVLRPAAWDQRSATPLAEEMTEFAASVTENGQGYAIQADWNLWQATYLKMTSRTLSSTGETVYILMGGRCFPLLTVLGYLRWVYLGGLVLALVAAGLLRRWFWYQVAYPLQRLNDAGTRNLRPIPYWGGDEYRCSDLNAALSHYQEAVTKAERLAEDNAALERKAKFAAEAEEQRRMMTSGLAHELKTPLAIVHSYAEGLQEHIAEDKREEYLNVILSESERMDGIIQDMLSLSRLESGRAKLERTEVELGELAFRCFQPLARGMAEKQLTLMTDISPDVLVNADETRLGQVITNFASNAVRYTPEGGTITLRVGYTPEGARCSVENTCPPIPDATLSRVWEPFFRGEQSRTERSSGLGLTIARSIVELHGGKVAAERTKDGVKFSFTL